jgi:hypothetical protein
MSWKPDPEFARIVGVTITGRREAMSQRLVQDRKKLDASLSARGALNSGMRLKGHSEIDSRAFDEFAQGTIDDVLGLFRDVYGEIPVEAAPWIRAKLTEWFDGLSRGIVNAGVELARQQGMNWTPEQPSALSRARRRLDVELGKLELKARLRKLTPPERRQQAPGTGADVFVSHASEDKEAVARPIADALRKHGYSVWLDETELKVGDRLLDKIDDGLANCRFGVVILSHSFFGKKWTRRELAGLVARQDAEDRTIILPVWNGVDEKEIAQHLPSLAGVLATRMSEGLETVVKEIEHAMAPPSEATRETT